MGASGGPVRRTEVITMGSGKEQRNSRWAHSRRRYNAGYGIKTITDLQTVIEFFEERRGRLYGFRFKDPLDFQSAKAGHEITAFDQVLGTGNAVQRKYQLIKRYGDESTGYIRQITKPVQGSIKISLGGTLVSDDHYTIEHSSGSIEFSENSIPDHGVTIGAGFEFDIPVRFDADEISINLSHFEVGDIPSIPLVELLV